MVNFSLNLKAQKAINDCNHQCILQNPIRVTWKKNLRDLATDSTNIFIKNLDSNVKAADLDAVFGRFGT